MRSSLAIGTCILLLGLFVASPRAPAQDTSLAQQLGYPADARLLILHADDLGVSHSTNRAFRDAWQSGVVNSGSVMVPTPWFPEIAAFAREYPEADLGLHLTLTAEWRHLRWGPVQPANEVPTLLDEHGYLPLDTGPVQEASPHEVERELRAQVERAIQFGIEPTHLDSHMGALFARPEMLSVYLSVAAEFRLPVLLPPRLHGESWVREVQLGANRFWLDELYMANPTVSEAKWNDFYLDILKQLEPGVHEIIVHIAYDDAEMQAVTIEHPDYGSAWRQRDYDVLSSDAFRTELERRGIELITWRQIRDVMRGVMRGE